MASVFKRGGKKAKGWWYASWFDHKGKRRSKSTRTTDKATAERIARKHEADAALRRDGVIDPMLDAISKEAQRTIESHLIDYELTLAGKGSTNNHVRRTIGMIRKIMEQAEWQLASDISAVGVNRFVRHLKCNGRSARTIQSHLTAIKGFTKWLAEYHKLPRDPLSKVKKPNPDSDRRHERRMLLPMEWQYLCGVLVDGGAERYGMTAPARRVLYAIAIETGLRSSELRALKRRSLFLREAEPHVVAKAGTTKNHKTARQFIRTALADDLNKLVAAKAPGARVFDLPHETDMAKMFRADLAHARTHWLKQMKETDAKGHVKRAESDFLVAVNCEGERIDFHSLRHTCGAWLAMTGTHIKTIQAVMRHSTITLTMDTYGHLFPGSEAGAIGRLGDIMGDAPLALHLTGTDGTPAGTHDKAQRRAQQSGRVTGHRGATCCDEKDNTRKESPRPKPLKLADLGDAVRHDATQSENRPGRTRTRDKGIMSPLL